MPPTKNQLERCSEKPVPINYAGMNGQFPGQDWFTSPGGELVGPGNWVVDKYLYYSRRVSGYKSQ